MLKNRSLRMAVISNTDSRMRKVLADLGIAQCFHSIILSGEAGCEKPDRKIFLWTLEAVNAVNGHPDGIVEVHDCLHIGDKLLCDYQGARNAGMQAVLLRRSGYDYGDDEEAVRDANPTILRSLDDIATFLDLISKKN